MAGALVLVALILGLLVFGTRSYICSNGQFKPLPHLRNIYGVSYISIVQVVEVPGAMDGSRGHNTQHNQPFICHLMQQ